MKADNAWSCKPDTLETGVTAAPVLNKRSAPGCGTACADSILTSSVARAEGGDSAKAAADTAMRAKVRIVLPRWRAPGVEVAALAGAKAGCNRAALGNPIGNEARVFADAIDQAGLG